MWTSCILGNNSHFDVILFFKQPRLSQVMQRSAVALAPVNNDVIDNDVAPSRRRRRMDLMSKYRRYRRYQNIEGIEKWVFDTKNSEVSRYR